MSPSLAISSKTNAQNDTKHFIVKFESQISRYLFLYKNLISVLTMHIGDRRSTVVKVLCYKSEGHWFDPSWCHWNFSLT